MALVKNEVFFSNGKNRHVGDNLSGCSVSWGTLRGHTFVNCDFRNARFVGPGVDMAGAKIFLGAGNYRLLKGLTIERRNVEPLASSIRFLDHEAQLNTEEGLGIGWDPMRSGRMTSEQFLRFLGVNIVEDETSLIALYSWDF